MAMKLNIQMFGAYADANLVLNQSDFERATEGVRNAHTKMDDLFTQQMALFTRDVHAEVWADGNCKTWFAGEFTTKTKIQLDSIAEQFNNILRGLDGLWSNVCSDLSVSKTGSAGSVSSSGNVDVSATQTDTFDDGTSGRRTYVGKHAETDMGQLNATLAPARHALREAVSIIGVYDNLGSNSVQRSVDSAIENINESMAKFSEDISANVNDVMQMTDQQYNTWAEGLKVSVVDGE